MSDDTRAAAAGDGRDDAPIPAGGELVAATIAAGLASACIPLPRVGWILTAGVGVTWAVRTRARGDAWRRGLRSWAWAAWGSALAACGLGADYAVGASPLGHAAAVHTSSWLAGTAAPEGVLVLAALALGTVALTVVFGRAGAFVALAAVLHRVAVVSAAIWSVSDNLILAAPAALLPWELAVAAGLVGLAGALADAPDASVSARARALADVLRPAADGASPARRGARIALGLLVAGIVLRVAATGAWAAMAAARTVAR